MNLRELMQLGTDKFRQASNFARHPLEILTQGGKHFLEEKINEIDVPWGQPSLPKTKPPVIH